jgi:hypothetical protein
VGCLKRGGKMHNIEGKRPQGSLLTGLYVCYNRSLKHNDRYRHLIYHDTLLCISRSHDTPF